MVNDLLKWSYQQLDGVGLDTEECDLNKVMESIKDEFYRMAQDKNITIEMELSQPTLVIDPTMLQVVLRNLTSNAIKFSDNGQKVVLWSQKQGEHIELGVKDFGMGMEKDWYQRLQNDKRPEIRKGTKGEKGTGFGLVIAKDFVEMNGGQLICESEMGKGTNFILRFPANSDNTTSQTKTSNSPVHSF